MTLTPQEIYEQAEMILKALGREQEMSDPIIDLIVWAYGGTMPSDEQMWMKLQRLENLPEAEMIQKFQGPKEPIGLPPLNPAEIEHLQEGSLRKREEVENRLRRDLHLMLEIINL